LLLHETRQRHPTNVVHRRPEVDRRRRAISGTPGSVRLAAVDIDPLVSINLAGDRRSRMRNVPLAPVPWVAASAIVGAEDHVCGPAQRLRHADPWQDAIVELLRRPVVVAGVSRSRELRLTVDPGDQDGPLPG